MSFPATVDNLLNHEVKENFNIKLLKNHIVSHAKRENILQKLAFIETFEEISRWVETNSNGQKFIACPAGATDIDRMDCLFAIQEPIARAIKGQNDRKNGRDLKLIKAVETADYAAIADVLASTAWSYWQDHGFFSGKNFKNELSAVSMIKNQEENQEKKQFQKTQIEHIGAIVYFKKVNKNGNYQACLDFVETEIIIKNDDFELDNER